MRNSKSAASDYLQSSIKPLEGYFYGLVFRNLIRAKQMRTEFAFSNNTGNQ